jgi:hypothetical protein
MAKNNLLHLFTLIPQAPRWAAAAATHPTALSPKSYTARCSATCRLSPPAPRAAPPPPPRDSPPFTPPLSRNTVRPRRVRASRGVSTAGATWWSFGDGRGRGREATKRRRPRRDPRQRWSRGEGHVLRAAMPASPLCSSDGRHGVGAGPSRQILGPVYQTIK